MRKLVLFALTLCLTAAWMVGCGDSKKKIAVTQPTVTSNVAFIRSGASFSAAAVRPHFDLKGRRGIHAFAHKPSLRQGLRPMFDNAPGTDSVVMIKNDGTNETILASQAGWFEAVQLSLDGKKGVGTAEDMNGYYQVFYVDLSNLTNLNNLNPVQLTTDPEDHYTPQISPDGTKVLFVKDVEGGPQAFTVSTTGGAETQIVVPSGVYVNFPSYTPDGKKIVFEEEENDTIDSMNTDGTGITVLTNQDGTNFDEYPSVSADGKTITFSRYPADESGGEDIYTVSINGGTATKLTSDGSNWDPQFVNDKIVFISYRDGAGGRVYAMSPDGTNAKNLTPNDTTDNYFVW